MYEKAMGSLSDKLLNFIDNTRVRDVNYDIAFEMLRNYKRLPDMSISEIAEMCFVSTSTISRFCKFLGYQNFTEFKAHLGLSFHIKADYSKNLSAYLRTDIEVARDIFKNEVINNINQTMSTENLEAADRIVTAIHARTHIVFFGSHYNLDAGKQFQKKMLLMGKYVELYTDWDEQYASAQKLKEDSLAIVLSQECSYLSRYAPIWSMITDSKASIALITQNINSIYCCIPDYVMQCGVTNRDNSGKYGALLAVDLLLMLYYAKYCSE